MSDWSVNAARASGERQLQKRISDEKIVQDRQVISEGGQTLWSELSDLLTNRCVDFNSEPGQRGTLVTSASGSTVIVSSPLGGGMVVGEYKRTHFTFTGQNGLEYENKLTLRLTTDGANVWLRNARKQPSTLDNVVDDVIESLLVSVGR